MVVFEIVGALMIMLSLGAMVNTDTRDNRVRVTRQ
jgi:hypothetical protein